jgi:hypothetical protein
MPERLCKACKVGHSRKMFTLEPNETRTLSKKYY